MLRREKERIVEDLTERLKGSQALIVTDFRGLTMPQIDALRSELLEHGARFQVVKNTLTRKAAEEAGADAVLALLEGPSAIAFLETDGDPVAVAKALTKAARETKILEVRGGVLEGKTITAADVDELAKLPPADVLRAQLLGAITAPLTTIVGLFAAPLQNLVGLIDARIEQLGGSPDAETSEAETSDAAAEPQAEAEPHAEAEIAPEPEAEAAPEPEAAAEDAAAEAEPAAEQTAEETTEETTEEE
jgi:large subunit ribosomal protein L10